MFSLQDYRNEKQAILNNTKLSKEGIDDAMAKFERKYKSDARKAIKALRKDAVVNALAWSDAQSERLEKEKQAQENINYERLNYEVSVTASRIKSSDNLSDVMQIWDSVKGSSDAFAIKAFKETSQGLIAEKFVDDADYSDMRGSLFEDMQNTQAEIVQVDVSQDEIDAKNKLAEIESEAGQINEAFGDGDAVVKRVFDGIGFDDDKVELGFDYDIHLLTGVKETKSEVAWRLERERQASLESYEKVMRDKNFEGEIDSDFGDFDGAF